MRVWAGWSGGAAGHMKMMGIVEEGLARSATIARAREER
jgi:hypothetical protein